MSTTTSSDSDPEVERFQIDWVRAIAGALAAVASAVLLSTLGAAGTIIGAAIGSLVVTVSSAFFGQGIARSRRSLTKTQAQAREKVGIAEVELQRAGRTDDPEVQESHLEHAGERLAEANEELDQAVADAAPVYWKTRLRTLPWKRITWATVALFVVAILVITVFEVITGRSVSSITGGSGNDGTTISNVGGSGSDRRDQPEDDPSEEPAEEQESVEPSPAAPTEEPSESVTPSETPEPTPTETSVPTPATTEEPAE